MILSGQLVVPEGDRRVRVVPGQVEIRGERLARVSLGDGEPLGRPDIGDPHILISPGFIDAHLHIPQFDCIGVDGLELLAWLEAAVFPAEARWADADYAGQMATRVARRLLASGTTGIAAYGTVHKSGTGNAMRALGEAGLRGVIGQVLMDRGAPAELIRPAEQLLSEAAEAGSVGRMGPAVTPRFAVSCTRELLAGAGELSRRTGRMVQTHLSESTGEVELVSSLFDGLSYVEVYRRAGLLHERCVLGHGIWLSDQDRAALSMAGAIIAHCPTANLFLQAGRFEREAARAGGVGVALGSDIAGGPDVCMVRVARAMIETAKNRRLSGADAASAPIASGGEAWAQMTSGNADALRWSGAGRLREGDMADLVVIDPRVGPGSEPGWASGHDPLGRLIYSWDERWIRTTIAAGRVVYQA